MRVVVPAVARELGAEVVLASRDVTPWSHRRDSRVAAALEREGRRLALRPGLLLAEPESDADRAVARRTAVFTPFWRALQRAPRRGLLSPPEHVPTAADRPRPTSPTWPARTELRSKACPAPVRALRSSVSAHGSASGLAAYGSGRDVLSGEGTSHLGVDLHFGTLSPLQVETAALEAGEEATPFVRQLAWREFYHHQLFHRRAARGPRAARCMAAFREEADDPEAVAAWREGRTGIPVVDAAMRQLAATGWLSNRARLVVASFLTRHLLMDYRIGERHFMRHLIDGDVANNRGGWQWTAGVGADAAALVPHLQPGAPGHALRSRGRMGPPLGA